MTKTKAKTGVTLDKDIFQVFLDNPYMKRSKWINDTVRKEMISQGMLKVEA
jgi:hypothetical protein